MTLATYGKARTKRQAEKERRALAATLRRQDRQRLQKLAEALRDARKARRAALAAAVEFCREGRLEVRRQAKDRRLAALLALKAAKEAETLAARRACADKKSAARAKAGPRIEAAERQLGEARSTRRVAAVVERSDRERERERGKRRATAAERRAESDDAVRADLPAELVPVFDKVRRRISETPRMSRAEVFLKWAEDHPGEVLAIQSHDAERAVAELVHERDEQERQLRSKKRYRRPAAELAAELEKQKKDEEVPF